MLFALLLSLLLAAPALAGTAGITVNGSNLPTDVPPEVDSGTVLVPLRALAEALGAEVDWDAATATATVLKNGKRITVTPDRGAVTADGKSVPGARIKVVNDRILVPGSLLEDLLGARVSADATGGVSVSYTETVAGMSPEELFVKSNGVLSGYDTYKYRGTFDLTTTAGQAPIRSAMSMEGSFKKPAETYFAMNLDLPPGTAVPEGQSPAMRMEYYSKDDKMYQNINGEGWKKIDLAIPSKLLETQNTGDPVKSLEQIKEIGGIISAGTPEKINGKDYYTLKVTIDPEKLRQYIGKFVAEAGAGAADSITGEKSGDFKKMMEGMLNLMEMKIAYKLYINSAGYLLDKMDIAEQITMDMPAMKTTTTVKGTLEMYDFNAPVTMPAITAE
ncbi:MAG: copper amine oxidase N-terminal domain-containing protein [Peptococcaceae bacterium]|nr:copper amine oxidase N-terminal domain-containing protein [Peptococcaceae bacterium]